MGEWDAAATSERITYRENEVSRVITHPEFQATNLRNSVALLRLVNPFALGQVKKTASAKVKCHILLEGSNDYYGLRTYHSDAKKYSMLGLGMGSCRFFILNSIIFSAERSRRSIGGPEHVPESAARDATRIQFPTRYEQFHMRGW